MSHLVALGRALVERFVVLNLATGALVAGALLLDRVLARRIHAAWRIALYAPVAVRLVLPAHARLPFAPAADVGAFVAPLLRIDAQARGAEGAGGPSWHALAAIGYLLVAAFLVVRAIVVRARLARALEGAAPMPTLGAMLPGVRVVRHEHLGPMVVGLVRPRVVVPRRLLEGDEASALACVLRHEAAHLRRGDAVLAAVIELLLAVAWPIVPAWIAAARVRQLVEVACDEAALAGADADERRRYGHALLDMVERQSRAVAPYAAGALHFGSTLRARIEALASARRWPKVAQGLVVALAPIALLAACGSAATVPVSGPESTDGYGYAFEADPDARDAQAPPASPSSFPAGPHGRLPPEAVQAAMRARFDAYRACYEAGLSRNPKLAGTVTLKYVIDADGRTVGAADDHSTLPDAAVVACVVDEAAKVTYPKPQGGNVTVLYPIEFAP